MHPLDSFHYCPHCGSTDFNIITDNAKKCGQCGFEHYKNPSPAAAVLVFDSQDRLLCIRRAKDPCKGTLSLPGGFIELNETAKDAAIRETWEETGLKIEITGFLGNLPNVYEYRGIEQYPLDFYFSGKIIGDSAPNPIDGEAADILFIPRDEINIDEFAFPALRAILKSVLKK